ncbi:hypothetical protein ABIA95_000168 [Bradyrhizobium sp. LA8.1]|uniref:hypothetical protein n=1 Tax=unclassified Bradyrhizobium TaxID=2631580 RepID=UPI00339A5023
MDFNEAELEALDSGVFRIGVFFQLQVDPDPVRLWLGFGNIRPGVNVYDPDGALYKGLGELQNVPAIKQLMNGAAERVEFVVSGVSGDLQEIASGNDAEEVKGRPALVGFALMGADWSMIGPVHWCAYYVADYMGGSLSVDDQSSQQISQISLSCGTRFTGRRRPAFAYWSDPDQQARFPGDKFCSIAKSYAHGFNKTWPVF